VQRLFVMLSLTLVALGCVPPVLRPSNVAWSIESVECNEGIGGMDMAFVFKLKVKNKSSSAQNVGTLYVRSQDPSRPLPHNSTFIDFEVPGGLHPGEIGEAQCWVPCSRLAKYPTTKLDDGCEMQVSVDEINWFSVSIIEFTSDPLFDSLMKNEFDSFGNPVKSIGSGIDKDI
jgi:hypothetical protein